MNTNHETHSQVEHGAAGGAARSSIDGGAAALWASAFVILAMILVQAGQRGGTPAYAGNEAEVGTLRILTADAGSGEDVLIVLNQTDEVMSVYSVEGQRSVELYQTVPLAELFAGVRAAPNQNPRR